LKRPRGPELIDVIKSRCAGVIVSSAIGGRRHGAIVFRDFFLDVLVGAFIVVFLLVVFFLAGIGILG